MQRRAFVSGSLASLAAAFWPFKSGKALPAGDWTSLPIWFDDTWVGHPDRTPLNKLGVYHVHFHGFDRSTSSTWAVSRVVDGVEYDRRELIKPEGGRHSATLRSLLPAAFLAQPDADVEIGMVVGRLVTAYRLGVRGRA